MNQKINSEKQRYVLLLNETTKASLSKAEKQLSTKITSSTELSSKVRAQDIYENGNALFLKNLGVVIVEEDEIERIKKFQSKKNSPLLYWEKSEPIFRPVSEIDLIQELRNSVLNLSGQIDQLEEYLKIKDEEQVQNVTWGLKAVGIEHSKFSGKGIDICILDTGFYMDHPDFKDRDIKGKSFVNEQNWETDLNGHGTHCTGSATGNISSETGLRYGIASDAAIRIAKVLADNGDGSTDAIVDALDNCIEKKHKVVSMSFGAPVKIGGNPSPIFEHIGKRALENNCLLIAAAGNDSNRPNLPKPVSSPANCESIMAVAALSKSLSVAKFSNAGINASNGGKIDVSAPGTEIYSSFSPNAAGNKLHGFLSGTSMATPHVSGIAALYCEAYPNDSASEIWRKLEKRCQQLNNELIRNVGNGLIQVT